MATIELPGQQLNLIIQESVLQKAEKANISQEDIQRILQNNVNTIQTSRENEDVLLMGNITITFYKSLDELVVTNLFGKQNIY